MLPRLPLCLFFFNDTATTEIYTLSLHDALPILSALLGQGLALTFFAERRAGCRASAPRRRRSTPCAPSRSEEHTSELQSPDHLVCRLLLEKKKQSSLVKPARSRNMLSCSSSCDS